MVKPIANRLANAPSSAVRLSGNCIGHMSATATAPKIRPLTTAPVNLRMW